MDKNPPALSGILEQLYYKHKGEPALGGNVIKGWLSVFEDLRLFGGLEHLEAEVQN